MHLPCLGGLGGRGASSHERQMRDRWRQEDQQQLDMHVPAISLSSFLPSPLSHTTYHHHHLPPTTHTHIPLPCTHTPHLTKSLWEGQGGGIFGIKTTFSFSQGTPSLWRAKLCLFLPSPRLTSPHTQMSTPWDFCFEMPASDTFLPMCMNNSLRREKLQLCSTRLLQIPQRASDIFMLFSLFA